MPGVQIKRAVQERLLAKFGPDGDQRLKHVDSQFPRLSEQIESTDYPKANISIWGHTEAQTAGGRSTPPYGLKQLAWEVTVHLSHLMSEPLKEGDAWDQLLDDVEAELRLGADLTAASGSPFAFSNRLSRETLPPIRDQLENAYYTNITFYVVEAINA